jgi:hypothetical protein
MKAYFEQKNPQRFPDLGVLGDELGAFAGGKIFPWAHADESDCGKRWSPEGKL